MLKIPVTGKPLKPCPFCGSAKVSMYDNSIRDYYFYKSESYMVKCNTCDANIERYSITGAKRAWNRRELEGKAFVDGYKEGLKI